MGMGFPSGVMSVWNETEVEAAPHCECAECHGVSKWFVLCYVNFGSIKKKIKIIINNESNGFEEPPNAPRALVSQSDSGHLADWEAKVGYPAVALASRAGLWPRLPWCSEAPFNLASLLWTRVMNWISGYQPGGQGLNCDTAQLPSVRQARGPALWMQSSPTSHKQPYPSFPVFTGKVRMLWDRLSLQEVAGSE